MPEPPDLRQQILVTARQLFIEQGYRGLPMRRIAEAVGVSKAALYYHFRDKEELFLAVLDLYLDEMEALIQQTQAESRPVRQQVFALVEAILSQPAEERALIRMAAQEMIHLSSAAQERLNQAYREKLIQPIRKMLKTGIDGGELKPVDPGVATWSLLGMMYPYFYPNQAREAPATPELTRQITSIFLNGAAAGGQEPK